MNAVAGRRPETVKLEPFRFEQMRPGCYDVDARVRDMDINGVWASLNFPSQITGFCGRVFFACSGPRARRRVRPRVERLAVRGVVRTRIPTASSRSASRTSPIRRSPRTRSVATPRAASRSVTLPGAPARDRPAVAVGPRPLGPDHRGVRRDRHGRSRCTSAAPGGYRVPARARPTLPARRHDVRPAVARRVRRVAVVRLPGASTRP